MMNTHLPRPALQEFEGVVYGLLAACIWGCYLAVSGQGLNGGLDASDLAFVGTLTAGLLMLPWLVLCNHFAKVGIKKALVLTLLSGPLFGWLTLHGLSQAPLIHGAVIEAAVLILGSVLLRRFTRQPAAGHDLVGLAVLLLGLVCVSGVVLPASPPAAESFHGDLFFVAAGLLWALQLVLLARWQVEPVAATVVVCVLSALLYCPLYLWLHGPLHLSMQDSVLIYSQVLVQGLLAALLGFYAFVKSVRYLGPGRAALFPAMSPVVSMILGILLFHQVPDATQWLGFAVVSAGLLLSLYREYA